MWKKIIRLVAIGLVIWFVVRAVQVLHPTDLRKSLLLLVSNPLWLLFAAVGYSVAVCCKALAWQTLLPRDVVRTRTLVGYLQIANLINHIAPIKAGELFRLWVLRERHGQPLLASTAVVALTRVFDVIVLLGSSLLLAGSMLPVLAANRRVQVFGLVVIGGLLVLGIFDMLRRRNKRRHFPGNGSGRGGALFAAFSQVKFSWRTGLRVLFWTSLSWLAETTVLWAVLRSLQVPFRWNDAWLVNNLTIIGQVFHITPGAIGTYETTLSGLLQLFGLSAEQALLVAVLAHGFLFLYSFLAGGVAMLLQSLRVRDVRRSLM